MKTKEKGIALRAMVFSLLTLVFPVLVIVLYFAVLETVRGQTAAMVGGLILAAGCYTASILFMYKAINTRNEGGFSVKAWSERNDSIRLLKPGGIAMVALLILNAVWQTQALGITTVMLFGLGLVYFLASMKRAYDSIHLAYTYSPR